MAKTKESSRRAINTSTKTTPYWQIGIIFPDGKKITKLDCSLHEFCKTYFLNLEKLITPEISAEELLNKYKDNYKAKGIKIGVNYIDSWSHKWSGKKAWPSDDKLIEYLNNQINGRNF